MMPGDEYVLDLLAEHLGRLRRADLAGVTRPAPLEPTLDGAAKRRARRDRLNNRKRVLTAESSARWANAIIGDDQYRLARDAEYRDVIGLRAAIATIEERLSQPTGEGGKRLANARHNLDAATLTVPEWRPIELRAVPHRSQRLR